MKRGASQASLPSATSVLAPSAMPERHVPRRVMVESEDRTLLLDLTAATEILERVMEALTDDHRKTIQSQLAAAEPTLKQLCTIFDLLCNYGSDCCPHGQPVCHDFTLCKPLRVGPVTIAAPGSVVDDAGELCIRLDLGLAYGSGKHPTTQLAIEALLDQRLEGARVADVGTGAGLLSIIAARRGVRSVAALDVLPAAVQNAKRNVSLNGCSRIVTVQRGSVEQLRGVFDCIILVVWNVSAAWGMLAGLARRLRPGGTFLMQSSASLVNDPDFLHSLELLRLFKRRIYCRDNYRFLALEKRSSRKP